MRKEAMAIYVDVKLLMSFVFPLSELRQHFFGKDKIKVYVLRDRRRSRIKHAVVLGRAKHDGRMASGVEISLRWS